MHTSLSHTHTVKLSNLTRLVLSNNRIDKLPPEIAELRALEYLNLFNNHLEVQTKVYVQFKKRELPIHERLTLSIQYTHHLTHSILCMYTHTTDSEHTVYTLPDSLHSMHVHTHYWLWAYSIRTTWLTPFYACTHTTDSEHTVYTPLDSLHSMHVCTLLTLSIQYTHHLTHSILCMYTHYWLWAYSIHTT